MKSKFGLLLVLMLLMGPIALIAGEDTKVSKRLGKKYKVSSGAQLELVNKYGNVLIHSWDKDSLVVRIVITAYGKNREMSQKLLDRTDVEFDQSGDYISITTQLDKSQGWLKDLWNELSDYSKSILSKEQLDVDYEVYLPEYLSLEVHNKFGDVFLPDRKGNTRLTLSNGNLKSENLQGSAVLDLSFGEADIASVSNATIYLKSVEMDLSYANDLILKSSSSKIFMDEVQTLDVTSRTDRFRISQLHQLKGKGSFTKIRLAQISGSARMDMNYGSLTIDQVDSEFDQIKVYGRSTDFEMYFNPNAYFQSKIIAKDGKMNLPREHKLKLTYTDSREKFVQASGMLGSLGSQTAELEIEAQGGKVSVDFAPSNPSSQKN